MDDVIELQGRINAFAERPATPTAPLPEQKPQITPIRTGLLSALKAPPAAPAKPATRPPPPAHCRQTRPPATQSSDCCAVMQDVPDTHAQPKTPAHNHPQQSVPPVARPPAAQDPSAQSSPRPALPPDCESQRAPSAHAPGWRDRQRCH